MEREAVQKAMISQYESEKVRPVNFKLYTVNSMSDDKLEGYVARLTMFDFGYGVIIPELYDKGIRGTESESENFLLQIKKIEWIEKEYKSVEKEMPLMMIEVSYKMLIDQGEAGGTEEYITKLDYEIREKLCFVFDSDILNEDEKEIKKLINWLKEQGIKAGIKNFGGKESTPMKLKGKAFEYVLFSPDFTLNAEREEKEEQLLIEMVTRLGYKCVVGNRYNEEYREVNRSEFAGETYYISGNGISASDLIKNELIGDMLKGIPYSIIERYGLEDKSEEEIMEIVGSIDENGYLPNEIRESEEAVTEAEDIMVLDKSFQARIIESEREIKEYYIKIRNELLTYNKVHNRLSWKYESFNLGREKLCKIMIRGKTLCVYMGISKEIAEQSKYKIERTYTRAYKDTPYLYRVTGARKLNNLLKLIEILMENKAKKTENISDEITLSMLRTKSPETLKKMGLIKEKTVEKKVQEI